MVNIFGEKKAFICCDNALRLLREYSPEGKIVWEMPVPGLVFEVWQLKDDSVLYCYYNENESGIKRINHAGDVLMEYKTKAEVFSFQPLEDGGALVGELRQQCLTEVDNEGKVIRRIPVFYDGEKPHEVMRAPRKLRNGQYMVAQPGMNALMFYDENGTVLKRLAIRPDVFDAVEAPDGHIFYACKSGLFELDANGTEIWSLEPSDVPEMGIQWLLGLQMLPKGNIVVQNWLGHGHHGEGVPLFEVNRAKKVVWYCACQDEQKELSNFQILDAPREEIWYQK